jgi:hypothetical protein
MWFLKSSKSSQSFILENLFIADWSKTFPIRYKTSFLITTTLSTGVNFIDVKHSVFHLQTQAGIS